MGAPAEYDLFHYEHQVPGGMITNLKAQLAQMGLVHRLGEVLEEIARVRRELGYAIMVTPFSQLIATQAMFNVVCGERYRIIPDEIVKYAFGYYGALAAPIETNVLDRIAQTPVAKSLGTPEPLPPAVERVRATLGAGVSDDELLLRIMYPDEQVRALLAAGPIRTDLTATDRPIVELARRLAARRDLASVDLRKGRLALAIRMVK
jgi:oxaloacetate decarboxylase alpha subunit